MKFSLVLIWLCLSPVQLQSPDDQHVVENSVQPNVWTELRDTVVKLKVQVKSSEMKIEELEQRNAALEERVTSAELGVDTLKADSTCRPKAAFTFASGLRGYHGPYRSDTRLVFRKKIMNVGYAFNPSTGVFTAPVRGVYYFRFSVLGASRSYWTGVHLVKNHQRIIIAYESPTGYHQYAVGGATLLLQKGDIVYVLLRAHCQIYDSRDNHSSFSGFLVFPM